jgi:lysophospholipase L1-like esterase
MRRRLALVLGLACLALAGCAAAPSVAPSAATPAPGPADAPLVAFYGDSYTEGMGASSPERRWSTMLSADRGWREYNPSISGLGFVNYRESFDVDLPSDIVAQHPDIVIVTMGLNDAFSYDMHAAEIKTAIHRDLHLLADELPDARLVVVEPFWWNAEVPPSLEAIAGWVRETAREIGADHIPGASGWIQGREGEMAADGLHPNDAGYELIYERMDAALTELGL